MNQGITKNQLFDNYNITVGGKVKEPSLVMSPDYTDVVREAEADPGREAGLQVHPVYGHQPVVAQQVTLRRQRLPLQHQQVVSVLKHPEPIDGEGDPDLDGCVQAAQLTVVEVAGDTGTQDAAHRLTEVYLYQMVSNIARCI